MRIIPAIALSVVLSCRGMAYNYGEHKEIGERAFQRFADSLAADDPFLALVDLKQDERGRHYFSDLSVEGGNQISYGVLNGISGDHVGNPLRLREQLRSRDSVLQRIISLHNVYLNMGYSAAPDGKLARLDFTYALLGATNLAHFYQYGRTFQQQLSPFDKQIVKECENPELMDRAFTELRRTNAINMYATLHAVAIDLAEESGLSAGTDREKSAALLHSALLFNAFADHFLEDAFAAGHLVVNRTIRAGITNNKALHDFYSRTGATVLNLKGDIWTAYGDGSLHGWPESREQHKRCHAVPPACYPSEPERIVAAVMLSLKDVWNGFARSYRGADYIPFLRRIPDNDQAHFLIRNIPALSLVPVPYHSDLTTLVEPSAITEPMKQANQLPPYRNFVRSRVGNSLVVGIRSGAISGRNFFRGAELRINAGQFGSHYAHNAEGGKRGTVDRWHGYTASYQGGDMGNWNGSGRTLPVHQVLAGVRSNVDWWVTDRKFVGIYGYAEAGVLVADKKATPVFVPSLGLQLGSLVNLNYYNMPGWLRIPLQYLLPLKIRYGAVFSSKQSPKYFSSVEMDFVF